MEINGLSYPVLLLASTGFAMAAARYLVRLKTGPVSGASDQLFSDFGIYMGWLTLLWAGFTVAQQLISSSAVDIHLEGADAAVFFVALFCCTLSVTVKIWRDAQSSFSLLFRDKSVTAG